jgi:hypothetical protein
MSKGVKKRNLQIDSIDDEPVDMKKILLTKKELIDSQSIEL